MTQLQVTYRKTGDLIPYARNARTHSQEQVQRIAASIKEFGFTNPILVDGDNGIIAGHGRLAAAQLLKLDEVPTIELSGMSETQKRAYILADNKLALDAGWDDDLLAVELEELKLDGVDLSLTGFTADEIDELINSEGGDPVEGEDDVPDVQDNPVSKLGDIWILGDHRLMCGDSTDAASVAKLMNGEKADICVTSPPYGTEDTPVLRVKYKKGKERPKSFYIEHDDNIGEWPTLMRGFFDVATSITSAQFINVQMLARNKVHLVEFLYDNREHLSDVVIWDKGHGAPQMHENVLNNDYEFIFVFSNENTTRTVPFSDFHGDKGNVIRLSSQHKNEFATIHKATFPVELPKTIMDMASLAESVYEPFCGTGTTIIACEETGRKCYAVELTPQYVDVSVRRWQQFTGRQAIHAETSRTFGETEAERLS